VAASGNIQFRVSAAGIDRSTDGGQTWTSEFTDPAVAISVVSCAAAQACWAAACAGRVLRRQADGTWIPRSLPTASDVIAVEPADANRAAVTLADGRRFRTADGGVTWTEILD
jgi:photosystem II stability/assembly factor-like uncharacterized protein